MDFFDLDIFSNKENLYLIPPHISNEQAQKVKAFWGNQELENHVFLFSSGTSGRGSVKTYALSKEALFSNAKMVNKFLNASENDAWLCPLPHYHVGGLSIYFRAHLKQASVFQLEKKWDPQIFHSKILEHQISFSSLVPTQLYDLVALKMPAPSCLKGIFIGGDFLADALAKKAVELGWPIIVTYGMTETCSQIASSYFKDLKNDHIKLLNEHTIFEEQGHFFIQSPALYSACFTLKDNKWDTVTSNTKFCLPDNLNVVTESNNTWIRPLGRYTDEIKIKGKLIDLKSFKNVFEGILMELNCWGEMAIEFVDCERNGKKLVLIAEKDAWDKLCLVKNRLVYVYPYMKSAIDISKINNLSKTSLGKIKLNQVK